MRKKMSTQITQETTATFASLSQNDSTSSDGRSGPATLVDVARKAGVSKYTVSAVLNGFKSNTRVSEETRQRILKVVAELHYQPNAIACSLRQRRTGVIGVYNGTSPVYGRDPFFSMILEGLQKGSLIHEVDLLMHGRHPNRGYDGRGRMLADGKVDGFVLVALNNDPFVKWLVGRGIPAVAMADPIKDLPSVVADYVQGGSLQAELLAQRGHKKVIFRSMGDPPPAMKERQNAFLKRARELRMQAKLVYSFDNSGYVRGDEVALYQNLQNNLHKRGELTAVACCNDVYAYRLLNYCLEIGLKIPQDLAIIGFDGLDLLIPTTYNLSTIAAPWVEVASTALSTLVAKLNSAGNHSNSQDIVLPVQFIPGNTL